MTRNKKVMSSGKPKTSVDDNKYTKEDICSVFHKKYMQVF